MTWSRKELMTWIDGEKNTDKNKETELRPGQLPEYSCIVPDELFHMFYKRNWFDDEQMNAVSTFNMCRDRHLLVMGNVPDFWDLDGGFQKRVRFYIYIPERGVAWVFEQENNPFTKDPWNVTENKKSFRKTKTPARVANFICQIFYDDWTPEEKEKYYKIRNNKRVIALQESGSTKKERYKVIKDQRDKALMGWIKDREELAEEIRNTSFLGEPKNIKPWFKPLTNTFLADVIDADDEMIRRVRYGREDV